MTIIVLVSFALILILGFFLILYRLSEINKELKFTEEFQNKFISLSSQYFNLDRNGSAKFDFNLYQWLMKNSNKMQIMVGANGTMTYFPPYKNIAINNYLIIINSIPKFSDGSLSEFDVNSVNNCLLRHGGDVEERGDRIEKELKNPLVWFKNGIQAILSLPIHIISWFGIIPNKTALFITNNTVFKIISGILALVGLLSGLITIIQGKEFLLNLFK